MSKFGSLCSLRSSTAVVQKMSLTITIRVTIVKQQQVNSNNHSNTSNNDNNINNDDSKHGRVDSLVLFTKRIW